MEECFESEGQKENTMYNEPMIDLPRVGVYFAEVSRTVNEIHREILEGRHPHQPKPTAHVDQVTGTVTNQVDYVFICSVRNVSQRTTAGSVVGATVRLAAQKIVEGTHKLATAEELAEWYAHQERQRQFNESEDQKNDKARTFKLKVPTAGDAK
jgi:hypothetical protein